MNLTDQQRESLVKAITFDVMKRIAEAHPLHDQHVAISLHESGHYLVGHALGLEVVAAYAGHTDGHTLVTQPLELRAAISSEIYPPREKLKICAELARAQLAVFLAGSIAVKIGVAKGYKAACEWQREPSRGDMALAADAVERVKNITGEDPKKIIAAAVTCATEIITEHWGALEGVADRLRMPHKTVESINRYLAVLVPISPLI